MNGEAAKEAKEVGNHLLFLKAFLFVRLEKINASFQMASTSRSSSNMTQCKSDFFVPTFGLSTGAIIAIIVGAVLLYVALLFALFASKKEKKPEVKTVTVVETTTTTTKTGEEKTRKAIEKATTEVQKQTLSPAQAQLIKQDKAITASIKA